MDLQSCPKCGVKVMPTADGTCPSCKEPFPDMPENDAAEPIFAELADDLPTIESRVSRQPPDSVPPRSKRTDGKDPFYLQATKFSLFAPLVLIVMDFFVQCIVKLQPDSTAASSKGAMYAVSVITATLILLTTVAALVLGFVGCIGAAKRSDGTSIVLSVIGILLNCLILSGCAWMLTKV